MKMVVQALMQHNSLDWNRLLFFFERKRWKN